MEATARPPARISGPAILVGLMFLVFAFAVWETREWPFAAQLFPLIAGSAGIVLAALQLYREVTGWERRHASTGTQMDEEFTVHGDARTDRHRTIGFFLAVALLSLAVWLFGMVLALPIGVFLYARFQARESLFSSAMIGLGFFLTVWLIFEQILKMSWGESMLMRFLWMSGLIPS